VEPKLRRENLLSSLSGRIERSREIRGFLKNLRDQTWTSQGPPALSYEGKARDITEEVFFRNTAIDSLTAYRFVALRYHFVIAVSFIVSLLRYRLSFCHCGIIYHFVIAVSLVLYNFVVMVSSTEYNPAITVPPSIVWFRHCKFVLYYIVRGPVWTWLNWTGIPFEYRRSLCCIVCCIGLVPRVRETCCVWRSIISLSDYPWIDRFDIAL